MLLSFLVMFGGMAVFWFGFFGGLFFFQKQQMVCMYLTLSFSCGPLGTDRILISDNCEHIISSTAQICMST